MPIIRPHFKSPDDEFHDNGKKPFVFDIIAPDGVTSLLRLGDTVSRTTGDALQTSGRSTGNVTDHRMILYANPKDFSIATSKKASVDQTMSGWIETYWGEEPSTLTITTATGAFVRLGTGLVSITGPVTAKGQTYGVGIGGTRRDTIQYDKMLDWLALFHNNGSIYDDRGNIILQGRIKISFDESVYFGWFNSFSIEEVAEQPFMFSLSAVFQIEREVYAVRTQGGDLR